jgi:hypothetical protein
MNRTMLATCLILATICGFAGGLASKMWNASPVFAQERLHPKIVSAESFVLVNAAGERRGVLSVGRDGSAVLRLYDDAGGKPRIELGTKFSSGEPEIRILAQDGRTTWSATSELVQPLVK